MQKQNPSQNNKSTNVLKKPDNKGFIIEKQVLNEEGENVIITIDVDRSDNPKPYLGGYQHIKTGLQYHNAFAQTDQIERNHPLKFHRECQTYEYSTKSTKVRREQGIQMEKQGLFIDTRSDKSTESKMYFSSQMQLEQQEEAVLFIQRVVRGMLARNKTNQLRKEKALKIRLELEIEEEWRKSEEVRHKKEIERRMHPRNQQDFKILYEELELWCSNEILKIKMNNSFSQEEKQQAMKQVLDKEIELLQTIDRLKIIANKENKEEKIKQFLKSMSNPKQWLRSDNRFTEVHTPFTTRAKELMDIYNGLNLKNISVDERLDILLNTKWTVKEYNTELTREIEELIDREADMINRGRPENSLEGLKQRLCNLFLQFIETPEFNPEAARFQRIPDQLVQGQKKEKNK